MEKAFDFNNTKKLGFGLMRLPEVDGAIDIELTKQMVDLFMERGFTYFDTAYVYGAGASENAARECIVERYPRDKFTIATKFPAGNLKAPEEMEEMFQTSLTRLGVDYVDYYLVHALNAEKYDTITTIGLWDKFKQWKAEGRAKHIGFSVHDTPEFVDKVLTEHPEMEFVQLQINYLDWEDENVQARRCWEVACAHNTPIIIMEPIKGGALAGGNADINAILKEHDAEATPASWALRFAAGQKNVCMVLSGMNAMSQVEENTVVLDDPKPITTEEQLVLDKAVAKYNSIPRVPCTSCRYCVDGCPMSINIPQIISMVNNVRVYNNVEATKGRYNGIKGGKASECIKCRACEAACPQNITIPEVLEEAAALFEG